MKDRYACLCKEYDSNNVSNNNNVEKRVWYSRASLLLEDLYEHEILCKNDNDKENLKLMVSDIEGKLKSIKLGYVKVPKYMKLFLYIDEIVRLSAVWSCLILTGIFIALPSILIKPIDYYLVHYNIINNKYQMNVLAKRGIAKFILLLSGISLEIQGLENTKDMGGKKYLLLWSHASTMDAFITSAAFSVRHYTLAKQQLFQLPFFSWLSISFDAIPIIRENKDSAINACSYAAKKVMDSEIGACYSMSPEGTRSDTGLLLPFKKGASHVWNELDKCDILPVVTFGAYELYPPGTTMTISGKVYFRYLKPITKEDIKDQSMLQVVRKNMLQTTIDDCPNDIAAPLTCMQQVKNKVALLIMLYIDYQVFVAYKYFWFDYMKIDSYLIIAGITVVVPLVITLILYLWVVNQAIQGGKLAKMKNQ